MPADVSLLLNQLGNGNQEALEQLVPLVYDELRRLAARYLRKERCNHTLQATALVHEAYLCMVAQRSDWRNRSHFVGVAAQLMRRILLMHARSRRAAKRGGSVLTISLDDALALSSDQVVEMVALDELLTRLSEIDPQQERIVELRVFGGLSVEETAELVGVSISTVKRDWAMAKAWLARELRGITDRNVERGA